MQSRKPKRPSEPVLARVTKLLQDGLPEGLKQYLCLVDIEPRKFNDVALRMPEGIAAMDTVWQLAHDICTEAGIKVKRLDKFATLEELDDYLGTVKWLWKNWMPLGFVTLLAGDPGAGKSMAALDWVRVAVTNGNWPTGEKCDTPNCTAVWVEAESSQQLLNDRSKQLKVPRKLCYLPSFGGDLFGQPDLNDMEHQQQLLNVVKARKPKLIVVDSLGGANAGGENKIEEVRPLMNFLADLARDEDAAVLLIHHFKKPSQQEDMSVAMYRVRGSGGIIAFSRSIIACEKTKAGAILRSIKSNLGPIPPPLNMSFKFDGDNGIEKIIYEPWQAPEPKHTKKELCSNWIWGILTKQGRTGLLTLVEMGEGEGYTRGTIYAAKDLLENQILVDGTGREAYWSIASDAEAANKLMDNHV